MSRYLKVETEFNDLTMFESALQTTCAKLGIEFEHHTKPTNLIGYQGDTRPETAHYIVRRRHIGGSCNDLGFRVQPDGTVTAVISEFDNDTTYGTDSRGIGVLNAVKQEYALQKVTQMAKRRGLEVEQVEENGVIRLRLRKKAASRRNNRRVSVRR